jgi:hypothetical protein
MRHRVDWPALCAALDMACGIRDVTHTQAAHELGMAPSSLTRMRQGHALSADSLASLLCWLYPHRVPAWAVPAGQAGVAAPAAAGVPDPGP